MFQTLKIKDVKVEIGLYIKALRKRDKITQEELAQQLNVSRLTIQHLEAGKNFTIETLLKALNHFEEMELFFRYLNEKKDVLENSKSLY